MAYHIRIADENDSSLLTEIGRKTYADAFSAQNSRETMAQYLAEAFNPQKQAEEISNPAVKFLLVHDDKKVVGYARIKFGFAPESIASNNPMEIIRFYSIKEYIGKGVGKFLMEACFEQAREQACDVIWLDVWKQNPRGIAFYKKRGFQIVGEQRFVMGEEIQEDWVMAIHLNKGQTLQST